MPHDARAATGTAPPLPPATARQGLTTGEARARLERDGRNELSAPPVVPAWRAYGTQLVHFFAIMLWIAGALAFVAGMPALGVAIFVVVVVNATFAFAQEYRAERAAALLRDLLPRRATVIRDGRREEIDAAELVDGDIVVLAPGDRISADMHVIDGQALRLDTSSMTGESVPEDADDRARLVAVPAANRCKFCQDRFELDSLLEAELVGRPPIEPDDLSEYLPDDEGEPAPRSRRRKRRSTSNPDRVTERPSRRRGARAPRTMTPPSRRRCR
jgi:magnesium-transporting ATPase (P-type)